MPPVEMQLPDPNLPHALPLRLFTPAEVAEILNMSLRSVRRLIADGTLPVKRMGRAVRIRPEALAAMIDGNVTSDDST